MTCLVPPQRRFKAPLGPALPLCPPGSRAPFLARRASASRQLLSNPHQGHPPQTRCYWLTGSRLLYLFKRGWGGGTYVSSGQGARFLLCFSPKLPAQTGHVTMRVLGDWPARNPPAATGVQTTGRGSWSDPVCSATVTSCFRACCSP